MFIFVNNYTTIIYILIIEKITPPISKKAEIISLFKYINLILASQ